MRVLTGTAIGCVLAGLDHLISRDTHFLPHVEQWWAKLPVQNTFDGIAAYRSELVALGIVLTIGTVPWLGRALSRYVRSWWAATASLTAPASAILVLSMLRLGTESALREFGPATLLVALVGCELWRLESVKGLWRRGQKLPKLIIPTQKQGSLAQESWALTSSDDPILAWDQDIIGRTAVVEVLAEHIFLHRTPIIELDGELGDGKSSALNLLRNTIEGHAIIVSFSAWLPGSHETLALDLFRDIATECRRAFYMPEVRKASIAYARTITGSVSFLAGLKEMLSTQSQREEIKEIREVLGRVPLPIVVLLDEVDRMQPDELMVLFKILRGASSIPNVTFICAFCEREVRRVLSVDGAVSNDYFDKFFPAKVNLAPPEPKMLGLLFQRQVTSAAAKGSWFLGGDGKKFLELLEYAWEQSLSHVCTNLRKQYSRRRRLCGFRYSLRQELVKLVLSTLS